MLVNDRLAFRASASDNANLSAIVEAMRPTGRGQFASISDTIRTALTAAAKLARDGALLDVLASAKAAQ